MEKIFAFEPNFAQEYMTKRENATDEQRRQAQEMFDGKELPEIYSVEGSTAKIKIEGPLSRSGPDWLDMAFGYGGTAYHDIIESIGRAENDPAIEKIDLLMDTPGGEVTGVDEVWQELAKCKKKKKAINMGMIASAGYWIASACNKIEALEPTSETGSIGVVIVAVDFSGMYEDAGIKIVVVTSKNAPNKRPDVKTKKGISVLQDMVDATENVFIDRIATGRKTTAENVRENYGRGALLIAQNPDGPDAIKAGMIDGMYKKEKDKEKDKNNSAFVESNITTPNSSNAENGEKMEEAMTLKEFLAQNPEAKAMLDQQLSAEYTRGVEAGKKEIQGKINAVVPFIGNKNYPGIEVLAAKVLKGESSKEALEGAVAAFDMMTEQQKTNQATVETVAAGDTPAQIQAVNTDGIIRTPEDAKAAAKQAKGAK